VSTKVRGHVVLPEIEQDDPGRDAQQEADTEERFSIPLVSKKCLGKPMSAVPISMNNPMTNIPIPL
jgi:hypothetical protein